MICDSSMSGRLDYYQFSTACEMMRRKQILKEDPPEVLPDVMFPQSIICLAIDETFGQDQNNESILNMEPVAPVSDQTFNKQLAQGGV